MPLLGKAAVAMWWEIAPPAREEFLDWHTHEHLPERLSIPGFCRGSRWASADGGDGFFVMYELEDVDVLTGAPYMARLNAPTPWSLKMMPEHRGMVRSLARVSLSYGGGGASHLLTLRLSPRHGEEGRLRSALVERLADLPQQRGVNGAHLLETERAAGAAQPTREQLIRGGDRSADWVVLVSGYDTNALRSLRAGPLSDAALADEGMDGAAVEGLYRLSSSLLEADLNVPA